MAVRAIYLTEADHNRLNRQNPWKGRQTVIFSYPLDDPDGYPIRRGDKSVIYSKQGLARAIPKTLP